ncbi:PREDICTED: uncharacterized protein LOC105126210 isoform X1 [Populus euphratica]|uniref:Uncharacterized protein LOC105126210 isoform X1 n=1 Tax=Populus euphratica TaxID=75702 RepID=A0AAJ6XNC3_POPEU|nr:PREDICTED: uncharacterized protein LOC105126210 isoform X1 [Populus euphratica]
MLSLPNFTGGTTALSSPRSLAPPRSRHSVFKKVTVTSRYPCCCSSLRLQESSIQEPLEESREIFRLQTKDDENDPVPRDQEEERGISKIQVSREKYIPVSKAELLDAVLLKLFDSQDDDANQFLLLSSCLDSILHAEHKSILEEMRTDYSLTHSIDDEATSDEKSGSSDGREAADRENPGSVSNKINGNGSVGKLDEETEVDRPLHFDYGLDLRNFLSSPVTNDKRCSNGECRLAVATRFQRSFMQLLNNAQFQELSAGDLMLTSALNSDYLLTLPVYVDWKKASESNAIIFRRGYATERQKGLLIVEKLDYVQSRLLQGIFFLVSKPVGKVGIWIKEAIRNAFESHEVQDWIKKMTPWLEQLSLFQQSYFSNEQASDNPPEIDQLSDTELPIWLAAQRAVSRYEGFLSPVGPRGRLFRKLLTWIGFLPPLPEKPFELDSYSNASEPRLRPIFLSRISLSDIWRPATRKYYRNNIWKMLKTSFSILLSQSVLQEPAFQELILLYTTETSDSNPKDKAEVPALELKIYERIPIPDLPVVFPHKKLSFRIIDTVRLDAATILGLLAYFINYKFEILSSPSAIFLDVVAITALIIYVTRVALGYKQTWDRYQLLVNKTLYEKTLASGFGSVHFLLDASEQQQYKEAILAYAILLKRTNGQVACHRSVGDECERFLYDVFKVKVEMPVEEAMNILIRLGLVIETPIDGRGTRLQAVPCEKAHEILKERWNSLLC